MVTITIICLFLRTQNISNPIEIYQKAFNVCFWDRYTIKIFFIEWLSQELILLTWQEEEGRSIRKDGV